MKSFLIFFFSINLKILAQEVSNFYFSPHALGMGGAFTAIAQEEGGSWSNPAGLALSTKPRFRHQLVQLHLPVHVATNAQARAFYKTISKYNLLSPSEKVLKGFDDLTFGEKKLWGWASMHPYGIWEFQPNLFLKAGFYTHDVLSVFQSDKKNLLAQVWDRGEILSLGWRTLGYRLHVGVQLRNLKRVTYEDSISNENFLQKNNFWKNENAQSNDLSGLGVDGGILLRIADLWLPSFGIAVFHLPTGCQKDYLNPYTEKRQTICGTLMSGSVKDTDSLYLMNPMDLRWGFSITPRITQDMALRLALDMHNLLITDGEVYYGLPGLDPQKQMHAGVELFFGNPMKLSPLALRLGYNQGFSSWGAVLRFSHLSFEFASYGQDVSVGVSPKEEKRVLISLTTEFN